MKPPLLTTKQAAEYLQISTDHLSKLARLGKIPAKRLSTGPRSEMRFDLDEVNRAITRPRRR